MLILSNKFASCSIYYQRCVIHRRASLLDTNEQKEKNQFVLPSQNFVIVRRLEALEVIRYKSQGIRNSVIKIIMKMLIKFHIVQDYFRNGRPVKFSTASFLCFFVFFLHIFKYFIYYYFFHSYICYNYEMTVCNDAMSTSEPQELEVCSLSHI